MSRKLFFNALPDETSETGYDRNYNADDLSEFLRIVCDTGVVKTNTVNNEPQGLKVVAGGGMTINTNVGKVVINGKALINDALDSFNVGANGLASTRYDYVVVRFNNEVSVRDITIELKRGTTTIPTVNSLVRSNNIVELMLAYIAVAPSTSSITQANITDTRGDAELCPWFTAVKGYEEYYDAIVQTHESTVTYSGRTVTTTLPSRLYNERYSLIEVYTNGMKEAETAYTVAASGGYINITFTSAKTNGAKITVILNNFLDGEGMSTALAQYAQLVQDVASLNAAGEYDYICNGVNDNILIGNLVRAFLGGGTDYAHAKFNIIGNIGMSAPALGTGTTADPYYWFHLNSGSNRQATIDFSRCGDITPSISNGTYNIMFHSNNDCHIVGANVIVNNTATDTVFRIMDTVYGAVYFENCRFWITAYKNSLIALRGTFVNCRGSVANVVGSSYCYMPAGNGIVRLFGGEYYAYTGESSSQSAVVGQSSANAVSILYGVNAPTAARGGFYQTNSILQWTGGGMLNCTDLVSALPMIVVSGSSNIRGTIAYSKPNAM